ncbi:MAG TPA: hypothetical protein VF681_01640 [Abditibacteriaceae bacterium]|jgi:hypothetical protein
MLTPRLWFALLCALGVVAITIAAVLEIARFRRGAALSKRQFRARMVSAAIWILILGANFYAVTALWPEAKYLSPGKLTPESKQQARLFLAVIGGSFCLIFVALGLFLFDVWQLSRERQALRDKFARELAALARENSRGTDKLSS